MKKIKVIMMLIAVAVGLAGSFAFKTPKHKTAFIETHYGIKLVSFSCNTDPTTTTLTIPVGDVVDVTNGAYHCDESNIICSIHLPAGLPTASGGNYVIQKNTYTILDCGAFTQ